MSTKVCKKCGWVYPITQPGKKCRVCGEPFDTVVCRKCGAIVSGNDRVPGVNLCKSCHNEEEREHMVKYRAKRDKAFDDAFDEWKQRIAKVPKNYPTLTDEQWMRACRHFNGCAKCGDEEIEARGFFVPFKEGGRYCDWNVIPLCQHCAADWKIATNPFKAAWRRDNAARAFNRRDCIKKIVDYLGGLLDVAGESAEGSGATTE